MSAWRSDIPEAIADHRLHIFASFSALEKRLAAEGGHGAGLITLADSDVLKSTMQLPSF